MIWTYEPIRSSSLLPLWKLLFEIHLPGNIDWFSPLLRVEIPSVTTFFLRKPCAKETATDRVWQVWQTSWVKTYRMFNLNWFQHSHLNISIPFTGCSMVCQYLNVNVEVEKGICFGATWFYGHGGYHKAICDCQHLCCYRSVIVFRDGLC